QLGGGLPSGSAVGRIMVAVAPSNDSVVYAFVDSGFAQQPLGLFRSANGGSTWTSIPLPPDLCGLLDEGTQCFHAMALAVDPTNAAAFFVGGVPLYRFTKSGGAYTRIGFGTVGIHVDFHALAFD